jgi:S-(hydroxymethyl)glutathione dehydrogenase / alcohol dehydrogenase
MKAAVCHEFGKPLIIEDVDLNDPAFGEVKVKLSACAICHSDITYMDGGWGGELPAIYGHEAAGVVESTGDGVTNAKIGDHVLVTLIRSCGTCHYCAQGAHTNCETRFPLTENSPLSFSDGRGSIVQGLNTSAFAEYVVVHASQVAEIPKDIPMESASLISCGVITGLGAVTNTAKIPAGCNVVVIGAGGVGLNSVQGASLSGAKKVIALDLNDAKTEAALEFGATHGINAGANDVVEQVMALTDGRGADFAFVTVGVSAAIEQAINLIAPSGTVVIVGMPPVGEKVKFEPLDFADATQSILGSKMGSTKLVTDIPKLTALYQQGRLKLDELVTGRYRLDQVNEALDSVRRGEALRNVIIFD